MKSRSQTKDHGHQSGSETSTGEMASCHYAWLAQSFPSAALGKAYEHHVGGKAPPTCSYSKNSLLTTLVNCKARMVGCQYDSFLCLQLASCHDN